MVIVPLMGFIVHYSVKNIFQANIERNQIGLAHNTMKEIDHTLYRAYQDIEVIAAEYSVRKLFEKKKSRIFSSNFQKRFKEKIYLTGPWDTLMILDKNGVVFNSTWHKKGFTRISELSVSRKAYHYALRGEVYVSDMVVSDVTGRPTVIFAAPITEEPNNRVHGVVMGHYTWAMVLQTLDEINPDYQAYLVNRTGVVIATRIDQRDKILKRSLAENALIKMAFVAAMGDKSIITRKENGNFVFAAYVSQTGYVSYKGNNWGLLMEIPQEIVFAPITRMTLNITIFTIMIMTMLVVIFYFIGKRLTQPIALLTSTVQSFGEGNLSIRAVVNSKDEISILSHTFNNMTENLQKTIVSRDFLDNIMKSMADALIILSPDATMRTVNEATLNLLGYAKHELIGQPVEKILIEEKGSKATRLDKLLILSLVNNYNVFFQTKSGIKIPMSLSATIMLDEAKKTNVIVCLAKDMTEINRINEEKRRISEATVKMEEAKNVQLEKQRKKLTDGKTALIYMLKDLNKTGKELKEKNTDR